MECLQRQEKLTKEKLEQVWHYRLSQDCSNHNLEKQQSIIDWLLKGKLEQFERLTPNQLILVNRVIESRYQILQRRYLFVEATQAYCNLINRLGTSLMLRHAVRSWVELGKDRQRVLANIIDQLIQKMLNSDRYIQQQITWIAQCSEDKSLRNALLLSSIEEYCLQPIGDQPLLVSKVVNFLRRSH